MQRERQHRQAGGVVGELADAVNSVFAVNGVGKSLLLEALCFAIRGTIPKLDGPLTQERPQDYSCDRFHS
jgi:hypothetical protein